MPQTLFRLTVAALLCSLGAWATQETENPDACANPKSVACAHSGSAGMSSSAAGSSASSEAGSGNGGTTNGSAGSSSATGGTSPVGSSGSGGAAQTGTAGATASVGGGGASAMGGATSAGGSSTTGTAGATAMGGAAATSSGGAGGSSTGGSVSANPACKTPIPARTSWTGTASAFSNACATDPTNALCNPPAYAFDADPKTRFSTGTKQVGTEWLQIDLGAGGGTVDQVVVTTTNGDYGRHLQIRMSNTDKDMAAPLLAEQAGMTGSLTFNFTPTTARYILISQTGMLMSTETSWWSVMDLSATCN